MVSLQPLHLLFLTVNPWLLGFAPLAQPKTKRTAKSLSLVINPKWHTTRAKFASSANKSHSKAESWCSENPFTISTLTTASRTTRNSLTNSFLHTLKVFLKPASTNSRNSKTKPSSGNASPKSTATANSSKEKSNLLTSNREILETATSSPPFQPSPKTKTQFCKSSRKSLPNKWPKTNTEFTN